jgi:hypothetical protein
MFAPLVALVVVVSRLPDENQLERTHSLLTYHIGATVGAGVVAFPVAALPALIALYDIVVTLGLACTAQQLDAFRQAARVKIALNPQALGDGQRIRRCRLRHRTAAPQHRTAELREGLPVKPRDLSLTFVISHARFPNAFRLPSFCTVSS